MKIYEAGFRFQSGRYVEYISSNSRESVEDYIEIMKESKPDGMIIVFLEKTYELVSTTTHIVSGDSDQ